VITSTCLSKLTEDDMFLRDEKDPRVLVRRHEVSLFADFVLRLSTKAKRHGGSGKERTEELTSERSMHPPKIDLLAGDGGVKDMTPSSSCCSINERFTLDLDLDIMECSWMSSRGCCPVVFQ
jgi:hypothetical protein